MADPNDIFAQRDAVARRQKLLDAMTQQNMGTPIQGNTGLGQALAKIATAWVLKNNAEKLDKDRSQNEQDYGAGLGSAVDQYLKTRAGTAGHELPPDMAGPTMPATPGDPRAAVVGALSSRFPEMQKLGAAELPGLMKQDQPLSQKDFLTLNGFDPQSQVAAALGGGIKALTPDKKFMTVGDRVVDGRKPDQVAADYRETFGKPYSQGGDLYQDDSRGKTYKLDNAPKVTVNSSTNVALPKGETAFTEALGKDTAKRFTDARDAAGTAYHTLGAVQQMKELESKGVYSGPTANAAVVLGGFAKALGMPVDEGQLANSQAYQQQFAKQISNLMLNGSIGRSMTDADRERFEQSFPSLMQSPAGRAQIYGQLEAAAQADIQRHKSLQEALIQTYPEYRGMLTMNPMDGDPGRGVRSPQPPTVPAAPGKSTKPSVSNW